MRREHDYLLYIYIIMTVLLQEHSQSFRKCIIRNAQSRCTHHNNIGMCSNYSLAGATPRLATHTTVLFRLGQHRCSVKGLDYPSSRKRVPPYIWGLTYTQQCTLMEARTSRLYQVVCDNWSVLFGLRNSTRVYRLI